MWQVVAISANGTYYPIAFFDEQSEANAFAITQTAWTGVYVEKIRSATLRGVVVDASRWSTVK